MSGNGVDMAAVYRLLLSVSDTVIGLDSRMTGLESRMTGLESRMTGITAEMAGMKTAMAALATKRDIEELRQSLNFYHSAVVGHGIQLTEIDTRLRRVEAKLGMASDA